ncbi:hypothetical protein GH733_012854 [Mirounga leonina]|nr:hypothetical protein GH733_012854 [Mirounga leonina]
MCLATSLSPCPAGPQDAGGGRVALRMPYRTLVLLSSLVAHPLLDPRVPLCCHTCISTNSAVNPIVYSLVSQKSRDAFRPLCWCPSGERRGRAACRTVTSCSGARETPRRRRKTGARAGVLRPQGPPQQQEPSVSGV